MSRTLKRGYGYILSSDPDQRAYRTVTHPQSGAHVEVCVRPQPTPDAPLGWWLASTPDVVHSWPLPEQDWRDIN